MIKKYIVRKYIEASSVEEALKKDKRTPPHDVFVDPDWLVEQTKHDVRGFEHKNK